MLHCIPHFLKGDEIRGTGGSWNEVKGIAGDCNAWSYSEIMEHVYQSTQYCMTRISILRWQHVLSVPKAH